MSTVLLAKDVVKKHYTRSSECVLVAVYHSEKNLEVHARAQEPDWFSHNVRQYLDGPKSDLGEYALMSVDIGRKPGALLARSILFNGWTLPGLGNWYVYAGWKGERKVSFILTREPGPKGRDLLKKLKLTASGNPVTCSKRMKRVFGTYHVGMWFGKVVERQDDGRKRVVSNQGNSITYKVLPLTKDAEGHAFDDALVYGGVSGLKRWTGRVFKPGDGLMFTMEEEGGQGKGHMEVVPDSRLAPLGVDFLFRDLKPQLKADFGEFTLGFQQRLHGADHYTTDFQIFLNMGLTPFGYEWASEHFAYLLGLHKDWKRAVEAVNRMNESGHSDLGWWEDTFSLSALVKADEQYDLGINGWLIPAISHRMGRWFSKEIDRMHMADWREGEPGTGKFQIRIPDSLAGYIIVGSQVLNPETGMTDPSRSPLGCGEIFIPALAEKAREETLAGREMWIYLLRQPNEHRDAKYKAKVIWNAELAAQYDASSPFWIVNPLTFVHMAGILGGCDQDDRFGGLYNVQVVKHLDELPAFIPITPDEEPNDDAMVAHASDAQARFSLDRVMERDVVDTEFTRHALAKLIIDECNERESIGSIVLPGMMFGHMDLCSRFEQGWTMEGVHDFSYVLWRLERVYDAKAKDGAKLDWVTDRKRALGNSLKGRQVPKWVARKMGQWVKEYDLKPTTTDFDKLLEWIDVEARKWDQYLNRHTHLCVLKYWDEMDFRPAQYMAAHQFPAKHEAWMMSQSMAAVYNTTIENAKLHFIGVRYEQGAKGIALEKLALRSGQRTTPHRFTYTKLEDLPEPVREQFRKPDFEIVLLSYLAADMETYRLFHKQPGVAMGMIVRWNQIYAKAEMPPKDPRKEVRKLADGFLWGRFMTELTIDALIWAKRNLPGAVTPNEQDAVEGYTPEEPQTPVASQEELDQPFNYLTVVNGNVEKENLIGTPGLRYWRQGLLDKVVTLQPGYWEGERAYMVMINGNLKAWIDKEEALMLWWKTCGKSVEGLIVEGRTPLTLTAVIL